MFERGKMYKLTEAGKNAMLDHFTLIPQQYIKYPWVHWRCDGPNFETDCLANIFCLHLEILSYN